MQLFNPDPESDAFATGCIRFRYGRPNETDAADKIMVPVMIENRLEREAMLDTGAPWFVLSPVLSEELDLQPPNRSEKVESVINIRGLRTHGYLTRLEVCIQAEQGISYPFEATTFVPETNHEDWQDIPLVLGFYNCMDRIRFAIDAGTNSLYLR